MKFYRGLYEHRVVRDAVSLWNRVSGRAAADSEGNVSVPSDEAQAVTRASDRDALRRRFRDVVYDEVLKQNERWQSLAIAINESVPDPLEHPDVVAYGAALLKTANKFEFTQECSPDRFLTANERRVCELSSSLGETIAGLQQQVQSFAADLKLTHDGSGDERDADKPYHALRLLALYRLSTADEQNHVFELLDYSPEKRLDLVAKLLAYMERGFSRAEALEYLRRRAYVPAALAQRALAKNVITEGYESSEESCGAFVQALRSARVPDDVISDAWVGAGYDPSLIEQALLASP